MKNWGTLDTWLREIHRALKPNGILGDVDRDKHLAIGESDRMTLSFVKQGAPRSEWASPPR